MKIKKIKPKIFKRCGFGEKDYKQRIPIKFYKHFKEYEDYLLDLKFENLSIFIICLGYHMEDVKQYLIVFLKVPGFKIQFNYHIMEMELI